MNTLSDGELIAREIERLTNKINPFEEPYSDSDGGTVGCIVEGQISTAKGLFAIARAIEKLADAIEQRP
jgi:hypothetical protein